MQTLIVSGGTIAESVLVKKVICDADFVIAADIGAKSALALGITPHVVIGDFDSLSKSFQNKLRKKDVTLIPYPSLKDETDTELALEYALSHGATKITIIGGSEGNRLDHVIANLLLATISTVPLQLVNGNQIASIISGPATFSFSGKRKDLISLTPLTGEVRGITTQNLYWHLANETLLFGKPRGISNVIVKKGAGVSWKKGMLLIVETIY